MWSWRRHQGKAEFMWSVRAGVSQSGQEPQRGPRLGGGGEVPGFWLLLLSGGGVDRGLRIPGGEIS